MSQADISHQVTTTTSTHLSNASQPHGSGFVRRLIIVLILLFVVASSMSLIAWLIIHPLPPVFTVNSFTVSNITFSDSDSRIEADYEFSITVKNPNKKVPLVIDHFDVSLLYKETPVTRRLNVEAVYLEKLSQQNRSPKFSRDFGERLRRREFEEMREDWSNRVVSFNVKMDIRNRFRSGIWLTKRNLAKVSCTGLVIQFSSPGDDGKLEGGGSRDCSLHFI